MIRDHSEGSANRMMAAGYICPRDYIRMLEQRVCYAVTLVGIGIFFADRQSYSNRICKTPPQVVILPCPLKKRFKDIYNRQISGPLNRRPGMSPQRALNEIV